MEWQAKFKINIYTKYKDEQITMRLEIENKLTIK